MNDKLTKLIFSRPSSTHHGLQLHLGKLAEPQLYVDRAVQPHHHQI